MPTLDKLKVALEEELIEPMGPEWTREGFIFNPNTGEVNEKPARNATATFRPVRKEPQ